MNQQPPYSKLVRFTGRSLLLVFLFVQIAPYMVFSYQQAMIQKAIKQQIKAGVSENDLVAFDAAQVQSDSTFTWLKMGKEFLFQNKMYDIVHTLTNGNRLVFKCIDDKQEKELFKNLVDLLEENHEKKKNSKTVGEIMAKLISSQPSSIFELNNWSTYKKINISSCIRPLLEWSGDVLIPPPNFI